MSQIDFDPVYPDVLGAITGGTRINMDALQCALGIFPVRTYVNQPCEIVLILQNMVDQMMKMKIMIYYIIQVVGKRCVKCLIVYLNQCRINQLD